MATGSPRLVRNRDAACLPGTEALIREQHGDIPVVFIRPAGVYDDEGHAVFLAHQIARTHERKLNSRVYPGNLDAGQPYLHLNDLVEALLRIVEHRQDLPPVLPLLLAEEETLTFRELQHQIGCLVQGEKWDTVRIPQAIASAGAALGDKVLDQDPFIRSWMVEIATSRTRRRRCAESRRTARANTRRCRTCRRPCRSTCRECATCTSRFCGCTG